MKLGTYEEFCQWSPNTNTYGPPINIMKTITKTIQPKQNITTISPQEYTHTYRE